MPELPDVTVYQERIEALLAGGVLEDLRLKSAFVLRSVEPAPSALHGATLVRVGRIGKRLVLEFAEDRFAVLHLMIAGRLQWFPGEAHKPLGRIDLASFDFDRGALVLTEAGTKKRASLHLTAGRSGLAEFDRGGLDVRSATSTEFALWLRSENRTLKRALTDPRICDGIGNAYSDEVLHRARLSPITWTTRLDDEQFVRLHLAACAVLDEWTVRLRAEVGDGWPRKVTAFREGMVVHGRFRQPCPECGAPVQRIRYADTECNYCANCQCEGRLLADRGLSTLLRGDWPKTLAELEERRRGG